MTTPTIGIVGLVALLALGTAVGYRLGLHSTNKVIDRFTALTDNAEKDPDSTIVPWSRHRP
jgi:hypothetical protein